MQLIINGPPRRQRSNPKDEVVLHFLLDQWISHVSNDQKTQTVKRNSEFFKQQIDKLEVKHFFPQNQI